MELWHGFRQECFEFEGRKAIVVFPETPDEKKNWTLKDGRLSNSSQKHRWKQAACQIATAS